jgi:hypothetical protein
MTIRAGPEVGGARLQLQGNYKVAIMYFYEVLQDMSRKKLKSMRALPGDLFDS